HPVHICICCQYNIVVPQPFQSVFDIERMLQKVEFLILIHHFFCKPITVQWLTAETKNSLGIHPSAFCDGAACAVTFGNEYRSLVSFLYYVILIFPFCLVVIMKLTIP